MRNGYSEIHEKEDARDEGDGWEHLLGNGIFVCRFANCGRQHFVISFALVRIY